ncbi:unnamed protein product [Caenorhabditis brenneri]
MNTFILLFLISVAVFEVFGAHGDHGGGHDHGGHDHGGHDHGGHDHGGHDHGHHGGWGGHDHHDHHHGGWGGHDHGNGGGGGGDNGWGYRPYTGFGGGRGYYGGGGGGLLARLFGWRRRGYYNNGYSGYPNYGYGGFCRLSQFVDYVGQVPRFYCDCPPYPPNYQWNQCSPMYSG